MTCAARTALAKLSAERSRGVRSHVSHRSVLQRTYDAHSYILEAISALQI
jgi:hypothetical protein